jgi:hypothetical protein
MSRAGRAAAELVLTDDERDQLVRWSRETARRIPVQPITVGRDTPTVRAISAFAIRKPLPVDRLEAEG